MMAYSYSFSTGVGGEFNPRDILDVDKKPFEVRQILLLPIGARSVRKGDEEVSRLGLRRPDFGPPEDPCSILQVKNDEALVFLEDAEPLTWMRGAARQPPPSKQRMRITVSSH